MDLFSKNYFSTIWIQIQIFFASCTVSQLTTHTTVLCDQHLVMWGEKQGLLSLFSWHDFLCEEKVNKHIHLLHILFDFVIPPLSDHCPFGHCSYSSYSIPSITPYQNVFFFWFCFITVVMEWTDCTPDSFLTWISTFWKPEPTDQKFGKARLQTRQIWHCSIYRKQIVFL